MEDYVKSLKTSIGSLIERPEDVRAVVAALKGRRKGSRRCGGLGAMIFPAYDEEKWTGAAAR